MWSAQPNQISTVARSSSRANNRRHKSLPHTSCDSLFYNLTHCSLLPMGLCDSSHWFPHLGVVNFFNHSRSPLQILTSFTFRCCLLFPSTPLSLPISNAAHQNGYLILRRKKFFPVQSC